MNPTPDFSSYSLREITDFPLATEQTKKYFYPLHCQLTGLQVGSISTINVAGHSPYLGQWKDTQARHPIFSLPHGALVKLAKTSYLRFCAFSDAEVASEELVSKQEQLLQICAVALLHQLTTVGQEVTWLPSFPAVSENWNSLIGLSYWKLYLESERFRFPSVRINRHERELDLRDYLQVCWDRKKEYERVVNDKAEEEKLKFAERMAVAVRNDAAGKRPLSPKLLWRWFQQNMPERYEVDVDNWMKSIFFATEKSIHDWRIADVELFEEMAVAECPTGTATSHAFFEVVRSKHRLLTEYYTGYSVLDDLDFSEHATARDQSAIESHAAATPEPVRTDYANTALYLKAKASWYLASQASSKHRSAALAEQKTLSVKPTFMPKLPWIEEAPEVDALDEIMAFGSTNERNRNED